jgi:chaperonin GroES
MQKKISQSRSASGGKSAPTKKTSSILPLGDRVLVKPFTEDELAGKSPSSIFIPDTVSKEKSAQGKVIAVGEGKYIEGKLIPVRVKVGDRVLFSKYSYDDVEHNGEEFYLLKEDNILAVIR